MTEKPVPVWWAWGLIAVSLFGFHNAYRALTSGVISGGKVAIWNTVRYYERGAQPTMFWFMVLLNLGGACALLVAGVILLLAT